MLKHRNPYTLPILLIAIGGGLVAYHGETLYRFDALSEAQVDQLAAKEMTELEAARGPHLPEIAGERRAALVERLRAEVRGRHEQPKRDAERWFFGGLAVLVIGVGHGVAARIMRG